MTRTVMSGMDKIQLVNQLINSVVVSCKQCSSAAAKREKKNVKLLLEVFLGRRPTAQEIEAALADN